MYKTIALLLILATSAICSQGTANASVKIRSRATTESESMGSLKAGSSMEILGKEGAFFRVRTSDNTEGFVSAQYVSVKDVAPVSKPKHVEKMSKGTAWAILLIPVYLLFGFITGLMMVRPYLIGWYKSNTWFISGAGPVDILFKQIGMRISFELFIAGVAVFAGSVAGWIYVLIKVLKGKSKSPELAVPN